MEQRRLLCVRMKYSDSSWLESLAADEWQLDTATDLSAAHARLQEHPYTTGLLLPGRIDESGCAALDSFLRAHPGPEWVAAMEPEVLALPACRDWPGLIEALLDAVEANGPPRTRPCALFGHSMGALVALELAH